MRAKTTVIALLLVATATLFVGVDLRGTDNTGSTEPTTTKTEPTDVVKLSKAFGHLIGSNLETPGITFDLEGIIEGMRDAAAGNAAPMTEQEYEEAMTALQESAFNELAETNLKEADTFLQENASKEEVVETEEGKLQYEVINEGKGKEVSDSSTPTIQYRGTYMDGTVFGSSEETGPISLPLAQTIPGFAKGIVGMKEGEKRRLFIHPDLGYGVMGHLPPNTLLIFEVEVISCGEEAGMAQPIAEVEDGNTEEAL